MGDGGDRSSSATRVPAFTAAIGLVTLIAVVDLVTGPDTELSDLFTVGPCLAAAAGTRREVALLGAYGLGLTLALAPENDQWFEREVVYTIVAIVLVTGIGTWVSSVRQAAERREDEANAQARQLAVVVDQSEAAVLTADLRGVITAWSARAEQLYGWPSAEAVGRPMSAVVPPDRSVEVTQTLAAAQDGHDVPPYESVRLRRDGTPVEVSVSASPLRDHSGQPVGVTEVSQDRSQLRAAESERDRLARRLAQKDRLDSLGQLSGGIAHDFNNLLAVIVNYGTLLLRGANDERQQREAAGVLAATERAVGLTRQLLTFSRADPSPVGPVDVNDVITSLTELLDRTLPANIDVVTRLADDARPALLDATRVEQLVMNLALNARDAMPTGGTITIETSNVTVNGHVPATDTSLSRGHYLRILVEDTGHGMTAEVREHAFDPFFTTKARGQGTGLGLATVYGICRQAGGGAAIYSEPGAGTAVRLYLPVAQGAGDRRRVAAGPASAAVPPGRTILLVEDEEMVRESLVDLLQEAGYSVLAAASAEDALKLVAKTDVSFQMLVCDVMLTGMPGPELAAQLRVELPRLPVLLLSGYTAQTLDLADVGPDYAFLEKPFNVDDLLAMIAGKLSATPGH